MIKPYFEAKDDQWVIMVGRFMLNMGAIETATRVIIHKIESKDSAPIFSDDLSARIGFIRKRFPRENHDRHKWAMNALEVSSKLSSFRNAIAHSGLVLSGSDDGDKHIHGIINFTPKNEINVAEIISLEELTNRVTESATAGKCLLEMQQDFG